MVATSSRLVAAGFSNSRCSPAGINRRLSVSEIGSRNDDGIKVLLGQAFDGARETQGARTNQRRDRPRQQRHHRWRSHPGNFHSDCAYMLTKTGPDNSNLLHAAISIKTPKFRRRAPSRFNCSGLQQTGPTLSLKPSVRVAIQELYELAPDLFSRAVGLWWLIVQRNTLMLPKRVNQPGRKISSCNCSYGPVVGDHISKVGVDDRKC